MGIPKQVNEVLRAHQVEVSNYKIVERQAGMAQADSFEAQLIVLTDGHSRLQFMIPSNTLLDLQQLHQKTHRHFKALEAKVLDELTRKIAPNIDMLPALPQLTGLETWVDERLLKPERISLRWDQEHQLEVSQDDFRKLIADSDIKKLSQPIPELNIPVDHWQESDLRQVNDCVSRFTSMRIRQRLDETLDVPPLPEIANEIIHLRMKPDAETRQLASIVEQDPSLAAQVVSWANSPYYGVASTVQSVQDAVVRVLGFDLVINLSLGLALGKDLSIPKDGPHGYTPYWKKAVYVAHLAAELGKRMPAEVRLPQGLCYLSGLLHNFGYLILAHVFPPMFETLCRHIEVNPHVPRACLEMHLLGITREQLASGLFKQWTLPNSLCIAIRYQNYPNYAGEYESLPKLLNLALCQLQTQKIGDGLAIAAERGAYEDLGLTDDGIQEALAAIMQNEEAINEMTKHLGRNK